MKSPEMLRWRREPGPAGETVYFSGDIDELTGPRLKALAAELGPRLTLDTGEVRRINSLGVRSWTEFMRVLRGRQVVLRRCSPAMMEQINVVAGFGGDARIASILAPYLCERCNQPSLEELEVGKDLTRASLEQPPERACKSCRTPMLFDDLPDRYLQFLAY